ncbi:MAG TPA: hypothetical protein VKG67_05735, partial [Gallionellaceae bacterium]|nr:hypothetical protein [Gallionellaceae bacterium]
MKRRLVLFLSAYRFHAQVYQKGALSQEQVFSNDPEGHQQFASFLQLHHAPALLLTDLIEEDFRHETVLHLRGKNRRGQLQRMFEQFYRNTPFRQAILHRRQSEGRRDDEMLFSALTNPHLFTPWLDTMRQQQAPLVGIYSVPTISNPLIKDIPADHILLLSWEKSAGLRQSYFKTKQLYLSRLSPVNESNSFSDVVSSETTRTVQYLRSLSLLPLGETLHAYTICHANDRNSLEQKLHNADDISYHYLDIQELGIHLKSKDTYPDSDATGPLLHLLSAHPPATQYAPSEYTHFFNLHQWRRRLFQLSALTATTSLLWGAISLWQGYTLNEEGDALEQQAQLLAQRTQEITRDFPHKLAGPADMKSAVTALRTLNNYSPPPQIVWGKLSTTLNDFPRIRIDNLSWQTSTASASATGKTSSDLQGSGMVVSGELEGVNNDYRGALDYLDRFQQALKQRGYDVSALTLPLDVSSKGSIANNAGDTR